MEYTQTQIKELAHTMGLILSDMGSADMDKSVCLFVKAKARLAYEPFNKEGDDHIMKLERAKEIVESIQRRNG